MAPLLVTPITGIHRTVEKLQPETFLNTDVDVTSKTLGMLKTLYDYAKDQEGQLDQLQISKLTPSTSVSKKKKRKIGFSSTEAPLSELIIESFDSEQIWEEIQLQNRLMYENLVTSVSKLLSHANSLQNQRIEELSDQEDGPISQVHQADDFDSEENVSEIEFEGNIRRTSAKKTKSTKSTIYSKSIVDDKFFNLAQMTEFLESVESQIEADRNREHDTEGDEVDLDNSIDLFEDMEGDEDEEKDNNIYYEEFFDKPLGDKEQEGSELSEDEEHDVEVDEDNDEDDSNEEFNSHEKEVILNLEKDEDISSSDSEDLDEVQQQVEKASSKALAPITPDTNLSNFEKRRKKIEENIKQMEEEALHPKGWQFQGEVTAERRPENSLLEEHLLFDHLLRQAPEITAETTLKLEDIIKQRIKDQAWDDVERKLKPVDTPFEYKNKLVLNSEKSKQSLAQIYEQEYINKKKTEDGQDEVEAVPEEEAKIQKDMKTLFSKLDALSNFHFTPKPPSVDVKIVTNLPSIAMEEVAPVSVSDATLLAPQEIQAPVKSEVKTHAERTETDKKRERRLKKKKQHLKRVDREERARLKGLGLRNVKLADNIISKKKSKTKGENPEEGFQNTKELKSSKAFFSKLQSQVHNQIKEKLNKSKKLDTKKNPQAKRFKL